MECFPEEGTLLSARVNGVPRSVSKCNGWDQVGDKPDDTTCNAISPLPPARMVCPPQSQAVLLELVTPLRVPQVSSVGVSEHYVIPFACSTSWDSCPYRHCPE